MNYSTDNLLALKPSTIREALLLIDNDDFQLSVYAAYKELAEVVRITNESFKAEWEAEVADWEATKPSASDSQDAEYMLAQWVKKNPRPRLKSVTTMNPQMPEWSEFVDWLYKGNNLISYCFHANAFDSTDISESSNTLAQYRRSLMKVFMSTAPRNFQEEWKEYEQELRENDERAKREEAEARTAEILEQVDQVAAIVPTHELTPEEIEAANPLAAITKLAATTANQIAELARLVPAALAADSSSSTITAVDAKNIAKALTMAYTANSSQIKTMEKIVACVARGQFADCPPMSYNGIKFLYEWLLSLETSDKVSSSKVFSIWFTQGKGIVINNHIRGKLRLPPLPVTDLINLL